MNLEINKDQEKKITDDPTHNRAKSMGHGAWGRGQRA